MTLKELSQRIARTARETGRTLRHSVGGVLQMYGPTRVIYNLNYCPGRQQQRVALVFLSRIHDRFGQTEDAFHPSTEQHLMMLNVLLELGFVEGGHLRHHLRLRPSLHTSLRDESAGSKNTVHYGERAVGGT